MQTFSFLGLEVSEKKVLTDDDDDANDDDRQTDHDNKTMHKAKFNLHLILKDLY